MPGITSRALPSPTSTGRASIMRSVASVFAFSTFMVVLLSNQSFVLGMFPKYNQYGAHDLFHLHPMEHQVQAMLGGSTEEPKPFAGYDLNAAYPTEKP
jgi:hypothetical protein